MEKLIIPYLYRTCSAEDEKNLFDIIIKSPSLKEVNVGLRKITNEEIKKINKNNNNEIEKMKIVYKMENVDFRNFIHNFRNIKTLQLLF